MLTLDAHLAAALTEASGTKALLAQVVRRRKIARGTDLLRVGEKPEVAHVLLAGHTCRYRVLSEGRRQITAVLVPGDVCDLEAVLRGRAEASTGALTECEVGEIPCEALSVDGALGEAVVTRLVRDAAIAQERVVSLGGRDARQRMAHLLCELYARLAAVGLASKDACAMPLTQTDLGEMLGLSAVHVNRVLQGLRKEGVLALQHHRLTLLDRTGLEQLAEFDPLYLEPSVGVRPAH